MSTWAKISLVILGLAILAFGWYWYSYRPSEITMNCQKTTEAAKYALPGLDYDLSYTSCLRDHGLAD